MDARKRRQARNAPFFGPAVMLVAIVVLVGFFVGSCSLLSESSEDAIRERVQEAREDAADKIEEKADELEGRIRGRDEPEQPQRRDTTPQGPPQVQPDGTLVLDPYNRYHVLDVVRRYNNAEVVLAEDVEAVLFCFGRVGPNTLPMRNDNGKGDIGCAPFGDAVLSNSEHLGEQACSAYGLRFYGVEQKKLLCGPGV